MAETPKVRNTIARTVGEKLKEAGIAVEPLLKEAGLQAYHLNQDDGWLRYEGYARLLEAAAREFKDPYYGLNFARCMDPRDFGALAYVGLSSKTLEDALLNLARYSKVQTEAWRFDLITEGPTAVVHAMPAKAAFNRYPQAAELGMGMVVFAYLAFLGQPLAPLEIWFVHPLTATRKKARYEKLLGCPVKFGQKRCQIVLHRKSLLLPIKTADDRLLKILKAYCASVLKQPKASQSDLVSRTKETIVDLLSSGRAKAKVVATELGMPERTLHRHLADEGTSFGEIREGLASSLAQKYIGEHRLSIKQTAFLLGYADQSAFGVAFKRWTGRTPKEVRAVH